MLRLQESSNLFYRVPEQEGGLNRESTQPRDQCITVQRTQNRLLGSSLQASVLTGKMSELKPVERPDSSTWEACGNHPVGHIGQVQVKPVLLVPENNVVQSEVIFKLFTSSCSGR